MPPTIISDEGTHFFNKHFKVTLDKYGVKYKVALAYHLQTNDQAEISNKEFKQILRRQ